MEEFLHWFQAEMPKPQILGWFHIMWLLITIIACTIIFIYRKQMSKKCVNLILLIVGILLILFEIYKQLEFSFNYNGGNGQSYWDYQWYAFPFQFCSTPIYVMALAGILKKGKCYDCIISYLATYALFGGLVVLLYPYSVYTKVIGINIQTMFWHSSMLVVGFMLLATKSVDLHIKTLLKASIVFVIMLVIALILNIVWHYCGNEETFNMFYISPYYECDMAVIGTIYNAVPYPIFLILYILGFSLAGLIILYIAIGIDKLIVLINNNQKNNNGHIDTHSTNINTK